MRKRGQGAIYSCSSGKSTPRAVERTTWLGRGPTVAIGRDFCWLKTRWAHTLTPRPSQTRLALSL
jgi:hypothetical protein